MFDSTIPRTAQTERMILPMTENSGPGWFYAVSAGIVLVYLLFLNKPGTSVMITVLSLLINVI